MKKILFISLIIFSGTTVYPQTPVFTWQAGSNTVNTSTQILTLPGAREGSLCWNDGSGSLWLFGGFTFYNYTSNRFNDLWKYDIASGKWTWMGGGNMANQSGIYGTKGTGDVNNIPGARLNSVSWVDGSGNLWLFGGNGYYYGPGWARLNDLWKYEPSSGKWTWMGGSDVLNQTGTWGTKGIGDVNNIPGARDNSANWTDASGNLWLFGGFGVGSDGSSDHLNDLWRYEPGTGKWTWMGGSDVANQSGTYGTLGTGNVNNIPGARYESVTWTDGSGNFWLFGGDGYDKNGTQGSLNDLWKYEPGNGKWTWMGGSDLVNQSGIYGTKGIGDINNIPGARYYSVGWTDDSENLWLFGGIGNSGFSIDNDLWKYNPSNGEWTWMGGSNNSDQAGIYGTQGIGDVNNIPGARYNSVTYTDGSGKFWLFGGSGKDKNSSSNDLNDLWKYEPANREWTWVGGSDLIDQQGTYTTIGTPGDLINNPGARANSVRWTDNSDNFWLFGGNGYDKNGSSGFLNDLWKYESTTGNYKWIGGSEIVNQSGIYGTLGVEDVNNIPGARDESVTWIDGSGNLWMFGGNIYDKNGTQGYSNDLWKFDPLTENWTWMGGSDVVNQFGTYGTKGVGDVTNIPGARINSIAWSDGSGNFWLFGGFGFDKIGNIGELNDLWKYDLATGKWTWMAGSVDRYNIGIYGTKGTGNVNNIPGSREKSASLTDGSGNLWMFGGYGYDKNGPSDWLNDAWKYEPTSGKWTWISGSDLNGQPGIYGTIGKGDINNIPGARGQTIVWKDGSDNFWLFGGFGKDKTGLTGSLNDLWKYQASSGQWIWVAGSDINNLSGTYGSQGSVDFGNIAGARMGSVSWIDESDNFWFFGGVVHRVQ